MDNPTWHEQLEGSLQGHESLKHENLNVFAKNHLELVDRHKALEGEIGTLKGELDSRVKIPGEGATDEERAVYRKALGVPEKAEEYGLARPEEIPEDVYDPGFIMQAAHELGMPKDMVLGLHEKFKSYLTQRIADARTQGEKFHQEQVDALKKDWGQDFEKNAELAKRAMKAFGDEDTLKYFEALTLADDPRILKLFHTIGTKLSEDSAMAGGTGNQGGLDAEKQAEGFFPATYPKK